jgi:hypothetical protein
MNFENLEILRVTYHKTISKSKDNPVPYATDCLDFCKLGTDGEATLIKRIQNCIKKTSHFFELDLENSSKGSMFEIQKNFINSKKVEFLKTSQEVADLAASCQTRVNIPDGLILIIEAKFNGIYAIIVVKAEKSEAFSANGNDLKLIKDIFLSSDKTLYKIGIFARTDSKNLTPNSYKYFVFDDDFSPSKDDLAIYFYKSFLGLTTEKNSKLLTNKMHNKLKRFVDDYIDSSDGYDVRRSIDRIFLDVDKKTLSSESFKDLIPKELLERYNRDIVEQMPTAFVKDLKIINKIDTQRIKINEDIFLTIGPNSEIIDMGDTEVDKNRLIMTVDSNKNSNYIIFKSTRKK